VLGLRWFRDRIGPDALARDHGISRATAYRCREKTLSVHGEVIDLWYSGKAHAHGGNIQAVIAPDGFPLWVSEVEPGSVHDITAARIHALPVLYPAAPAPATRCSAPCAAWANAGSRC
jgi:DDE superfamily endonuclease